MEIVAARTVRRCSARGLTQRKIVELRRLASLSGQARQRYVNEYWSQEFAGPILTSVRRLATARSGNWPRNGLTGHQNRLALESTLVLLKAGWARARAKARAWVMSDERWTGAERGWLLYVLDHGSEMQTCLNSDVPNVLPWLADDAGRKRLAKALQRRLLDYRGSKPRLRGHDWFTLDTNSYRVFERPEDRHFKGAWIAISGLEKRRRVCVPLAGASLLDFRHRTSKKNSRPGLLVIVKDRVTLVVTKRVPVPAQRATSFELGIDKGYKVLLTASSGDASTAKTYGQQSSDLISRIAEVDSARRKNRKRLRSFERSVRARIERRLDVFCEGTLDHENSNESRDGTTPSFDNK